jgi:hypothetical protein
MEHGTVLFVRIPKQIYIQQEYRGRIILARSSINKQIPSNALLLLHDAWLPLTRVTSYQSICIRAGMSNHQVLGNITIPSNKKCIAAVLSLLEFILTRTGEPKPASYVFNMAVQMSSGASGTAQ